MTPSIRTKSCFDAYFSYLGRVMKKTEKDTKLKDDINLDDLDDLGLDDDIDFGDLEDIDNDREAVEPSISKELLKETSKGFLEGVIKKGAEKSLPDDITNNYQSAIDYTDFIKQTYDTEKTKLNKSLYRLARETTKTLPIQSKLINKYLEKKEAEYTSYKEKSEEEFRQTGITSSLSSIFDKQLDIQTDLLARQEARREVETKERLSTNKLNLNTLSSIDSNLSTQTAFTLQISKEYYRTSLELQYKGYYLQADMLKTMRDYYKSYSVQLDSVIKNTGLPDIVKTRTSENLIESLKAKGTEELYKSIFNETDFVNNLKKRISSSISNTVSNITDKMDMLSDSLSSVNDISEMGGKGSTIPILGNMLGSGVGGLLGNKLIPKKIQNKIKNNKYMQSTGNYLNILNNSPSSFFANIREKIQDKAIQSEQDGTLSGSLKNTGYSILNNLMGITREDNPDLKINPSNILTASSPAIFDNKVHRSITEVIPLYLSNIHSELYNIKGMYQVANKGILGNYKLTEPKMYDYATRKLVTKDEFIANAEKNVFGKLNKKQNKVDQATSKLRTTAIFNLKDKTNFKSNKKTLTDLKTNKDFNSYVNKASQVMGVNLTIDELLNYEKYPELKEIVTINPKLRNYIEVLKIAEVHKSDIARDQVEDIVKSYPTTAVKLLFEKSYELANDTPFKYKIDEKNLLLIAKALSNYIYVNNSLTYKSLLTGKAFSYIPKDEFEPLQQYIQVLVTAISTIDKSNDISKITTIEVIIANVNKSLRGNFEISPNVLRKLYDYSPDLVPDGKMSIERMTEQKLGSIAPTEYIDSDDLKSISVYKKPIIDVKSIVTTSITDAIKTKVKTTKLNEIVQSYKSDLDKAKGVSGVIDSTNKLMTNIYEESKQSIKSKLGSSLSYFKEVEKSIASFKEQSTTEAKIKLVKTITEFETRLDKSIHELKNETKELRTNLYNVVDTLEDNIDSSEGISKIREKQEKFIKTKEIEIDFLYKIKDKVTDLRLKVTEIDVNLDTKNVASKIKTILSDISGQLEILKDRYQLKIDEYA